MFQMNEKWNRWLPVLSVAFAGVVALPGCSDSPGSDEAQTNVVYLCRETQQLRRAPRQPSPIVNPKTGRKTMFRALYCSRCKRWHVIPPGEEQTGNPLRYKCPKHRCPMSENGPDTN